MEHDEQDAITLRLCCGQDGLWSGRLFVGTAEVCTFYACDTPRQVEQAAVEIGLRPNHVEIEAD